MRKLTTRELVECAVGGAVFGVGVTLVLAVLELLN